MNNKTLKEKGIERWGKNYAYQPQGYHYFRMKYMHKLKILKPFQKVVRRYILEAHYEVVE